MPTIQISGSPIQFPDDGNSPDWAPPIIAFAEATAEALSGVVGIADVAPQVFVIDPYNPGSNIPLPGLSFSTTIVRGAFIPYAIDRATTTQEVSEVGELSIVYNSTNSTGFKWTMTRTANGDASVTFAISDQGQVSISTTALTGLSHTGKITFSATAVLQNL